MIRWAAHVPESFSVWSNPFPMSKLHQRYQLWEASRKETPATVYTQKALFLEPKSLTRLIYIWDSSELPATGSSLTCWGHGQWSKDCVNHRVEKTWRELRECLRHICGIAGIARLFSKVTLQKSHGFEEPWNWKVLEFPTHGYIFDILWWLMLINVKFKSQGPERQHDLRSDLAVFCQMRFSAFCPQKWFLSQKSG